MNLSKENIEIYAIKNYNNPCCYSMTEFKEDYNRTKYLKKLFESYLRKGILKERLIINHLVVFFNMFGIEAASNILFVKLEDRYWILLKSFLVFLKLNTDKIHVGVDTAAIPVDDVVLAQLQTI